ncbi:bifunctional metallophosphatase/5'-nucleotidase [Azospirillum sp. SYSU D00513]|uniref:bifunctional metallophosphatase/5'-nucleotidase n=1 Tax=Azospirillum sp. SYSU D00513 TaxID=2812561 RepID=UPI001A96421E|nr:bifunctional metallophosphatase/5'-nucleotidase [Azospirillum sp. SYSU D00513]
MKLARLLVAAVAALSTGSGIAVAQEFGLRILHVNDVHGRYDQTSASGSYCTPKSLAEGKCVGGAARLATRLAALRTGNALFLDAGDQFQGTLFYTVHKQAAPLAILSLLKPDAQTLGNHEFDDGPPVLARYLDGVSWPVLGANVGTGGEPLLRGRIPPSAVVTRGGERIGIVGLTTAETPLTSTPGPTLSFAEEAASLQAAVDALRAQGIDKIVALTHVGYSNDRTLAAAVEGVDVFVGGHSHTLLSNSDPKAAGPYPHVARSRTGEPVLVVQAGAYGTHLGRLEVTFDGRGVLTGWSGDTELLANAVPMDPAVQAEVERLGRPLEALRGEPVGESRVELSNAACRREECPLGNLIADAMLWAMREQGGQVAIQNGGGIRSGIPAGTVTLGHVLEVLPFSNTVAWADLTGEDLWQELENGVSRAQDPNDSGSGRFPQVAGMRYAFDPKRPAGERILSVEIHDAAGGYAPLDRAKRYRVVTNNFVRQGGDAYARLAKAETSYDFGPNLEAVTAEHIRRAGPLAPVAEGRVRRVE